MNHKPIMLYRISWMTLIMMVGIWARFTFDLGAAAVILLIVAVASTIAHVVGYHIGMNEIGRRIRSDK